MEETKINQPKKNKINFTKIISIFIIVSLMVSLIYSAIMLIQSITVEDFAQTHLKTKSDYILMVLQCFIGIIGFFLPSILEHRLDFSMPDKMYFAFIVFLYCAIYLGEIQSFYYLIPDWDLILHIFSGAMWGAFGFSVILMLNSRDIGLKLSPLFCAIFAFCFAMAIGAIWEIYEFTVDKFFGTNMQKFMLENGTKLVGQDALADTMEDIIVDLIGSLIMSIIGFISMQNKPSWLRKLSFKKSDQ